MALPKLNERLITKVLQHIKKFPESYEQDIISRECDKTKQTPCGAVGCFGGWAYLLSQPQKKRHQLASNDVHVLQEARKLLGLTGDESDFLFDTTGNSNPRADYKLIQKRLTHIRESRAVAIEKEKLLNKIDQLDEKINNNADMLGSDPIDYEGEL